MCVTLLTWAGAGRNGAQICSILLIKSTHTAQECDFNPHWNSGKTLAEGKDLCVSVYTEVAVESEDRQRF